MHLYKHAVTSLHVKLQAILHCAICFLQTLLHHRLHIFDVAYSTWNASQIQHLSFKRNERLSKSLSRISTDRRWRSAAQARGTEHLFWMLGQTSTRDFRSSGCAMFYLKTGRQQFPWKELARERGHRSVGWKTTLYRPAGGERKKEKRDCDTKGGGDKG